VEKRQRAARGTQLTAEKAVTATVMRQINRSSILDLIRDGLPRSRTAIAQRVRMSLPTVMRIIDSLIEEGLVVEHSERAASTGGRRAALVEFNGRNHLVISAEITVRRTRAEVVDLGGTILHECEGPLAEQNGEESLQSLCELIEAALREASSYGKRVRGICVGVPGTVRNPAGVVIYVPGLHWDNFPLGARLRERFELPVFIDNHENVDVLGELGFGAARGVRNAVCLAISRGMGAGLILDGALYRGHHQAAGEIRYMPVEPRELGRHSGGVGALVNMASRDGVLKRVARLLEEQGEPHEREEISPETIFRSARDGKPWAKTVVKEIIEQVSFALANVISLLDPQIIILGGEIAASSADLLLEPVKRSLEGELPFMPEIVASPLGRRATAMGAVMMVLYGTTEHLVVRSGPAAAR
jgi:glucokinase